MFGPTRTARARRFVALGLAAGVLALAAGCASGSAGGGTRAVTVDVSTFMFAPNPLRIAPGTEVTWVNHDAIRHTVTSGARDYYGAGPKKGLTKQITRSGLFDQQLDGAGATTSYTFEKPGTYRYLCTIHPGMDAEVIVG